MMLLKISMNSIDNLILIDIQNVDILKIKFILNQAK